MRTDDENTQFAAGVEELASPQSEPQPQDDPLDTSGVGHEESTATDQQASGVVTDIAELDMITEPVADVDEQDMEKRMAYAPSLTPGKFHNFIFALEKEKPVQNAPIKDKTWAQFNYTATVLDEHNQPGKTIRFCQATTFRSGKMESSRVDELLFSLGKMRKFKQTQKKSSDILALLQEAEGEQRVFRGLVQWRFWDSETGVVTSTAPQKPYAKVDKKTGEKITVVEQPWWRERDGSLSRHEGNETITRVQPTKETLEELHAEAQVEQGAQA
jgi:hypothetical protein